MVVKKKRNKKGQPTKKKITKGTKNEKEIIRLKKQLKELTAKFLTQQKKKLPTDKYKILDKKMRGIVDKTNDPSNLKEMELVEVVELWEEALHLDFLIDHLQKLHQ